MVAVITADLQDSSTYEEKILAKVLTVLKTEFEIIEKRYGPKKLRFKIYRGDSFQGIVHQPEHALHIALQIKTAVNLVHLKETEKNKAYSKVADFKMGIGIGSFDFRRDSIEESNGQAFRFSGHTLDEIKNEARKTKLQTPNEDINSEFNASLYLLDMLIEKWSTASAEAVYYLLKGMKEQEISEVLNISQPAVNQRKKAAGWEAISALLNRYHEVAVKNFIDG